MKTLRIFLVMILWLPASWASTELAPGILYQPGTQLSISSMGLHLTVPKGWQAMLPAGSEAMVMEPIEGVARIVISAVTPASEQNMLQLMSASHPLDVNTLLVPGGSMQQRDGLYIQSLQVQGDNPQNLEASAIGRLGDNQTGVFAILLEQAGQPLLPTVGEKLLRSITFTSVASAPATSPDSGNEAIDWSQRLRGRTLRYLKTNSGYSVDKRLNLCSDGRFSYSDSDSYVSSDALSDFSAAGRSAQAGRWKINGNQLALVWNDGSSSKFNLSRRYVEKWGEWGTFVDDERWFNVSNEVCQ